jgi:hypothetical protein
MQKRLPGLIVAEIRNAQVFQRTTGGIDCTHMPPVQMLKDRSQITTHTLHVLIYLVPSLASATLDMANFLRGHTI